MEWVVWWFILCPWQITEAKDLIEVDDLLDPTAFEEEPKDLEVGISVRNLTKIYEAVSSFVRLTL